MKLYWLSFADPTLPKGSQFLGVCIVEGHNFLNASRRAHLLGINPGGEVQGIEIAQDKIEKVSAYKNRLLSREDCEKIGW